jgi:hypothetical protein
MHSFDGFELLFRGFIVGVIFGWFVNSVIRGIVSIFKD